MDETYQKRQHPKVQQAIINAVSLNNAVNFYSGDDTLGVLGVAEVFRNWLNTVSQEKTAENSNEKPIISLGVNYPTPTVDQKKVLDEIVKRSGKPFNDVCAATLNWANKVHKMNQYPQNVDSINQFLEWAEWS